MFKFSSSQYKCLPVIPLLVILGFSSFSVSDAVVKLLGKRFKGMEIVAATSAVISGLCFFWYLAIRARAGSSKLTLSFCSLKFHLLRCLVVIFATSINFSVLPLVELSAFYTIMFTAPLCVTALACSCLRERLKVSSIVALVGGFLGVVIAVGGGFAGTQAVYSLLLLISACLYGASTILASQVSQEESPLFFAWFPKLTATVLLSPFLFSFFIKAPTFNECLLIALVSLCDMLAYVTLGIGFQRGVVSQLAPLQYTQLLWGLVLGFLFWGDLPNMQEIVGTVLVIASGLFVLMPAFSIFDLKEMQLKATSDQDFMVP